MIVEITMVLSVITGGVALMRIVGIRGWVLPALGFITGIAILIIIGTIQVLTALPTTPILTLAITILFPLALWFWYYHCGKDVSIRIIPSLFTMSCIAFAVIVLREINLQCLTIDSFRYITIGSLLESNNLIQATPDLLLTRVIAVPLLHAAANLTGEFYFRSLTPLLALSTVIILIWLIYEGLSASKTESQLIKLFIIAGAGLLVTNNRFVFHAFYINGHLLTAVFILTLVGCGWLLINKANVSPRALLLLQCISIPVLTLARPETPLFAGIALLPFLASEKVSWKHRALLLIVLGISITAWYGFLWVKYIGFGMVAPTSVVGMFSLGAVLNLIAPLLAWRKTAQLLPYSLILSETLLWLALFAFAFYDPYPLKRSIFATLNNILLDHGGWGSSLILIILISVGVLILSNSTNRIYLRFPLTTYIPFVFLLVYLREGAYRVGHGDSLNRMFIHILPLAILFIVTSVTSEHWGLPNWLKMLWLKMENIYKAQKWRKI